MARKVKIYLKNNVTCIDVTQNGKTNYYSSSENRSLKVIKGGVEIIKNDNDFILNNFKLLISELEDDFGATTGKELRDALLENNFFKKGGGGVSEDIPELSDNPTLNDSLVAASTIATTILKNSIDNLIETLSNLDVADVQGLTQQLQDLQTSIDDLTISDIALLQEALDTLQVNINDKIDKPITATPSAKLFLNEQGNYVVTPQSSLRTVFVGGASANDTEAELENALKPFESVQVALDTIANSTDYNEEDTWILQFKAGGIYSFEQITVKNLVIFSNSTITLNITSTGQNYTAFTNGSFTLDFKGTFNVLTSEVLANRPQFLLDDFIHKRCDLFNVNIQTSQDAFGINPNEFLLRVSKNYSINNLNIKSNISFCYTENNANEVSAKYGNVEFKNTDGVSNTNNTTLQEVSNYTNFVAFSFLSLNIDEQSSSGTAYSSFLFRSSSKLSKNIEFGDFTNLSTIPWRLFDFSEKETINFNNSNITNCNLGVLQKVKITGSIKSTSKFSLTNGGGAYIKDWELLNLEAFFNLNDTNPLIIIFLFQLLNNTKGTNFGRRIIVNNCNITHKGIFAELRELLQIFDGSTATNSDFTEYSPLVFLGTNVFNSTSSTAPITIYIGGSTRWSGVINKQNIVSNIPLSNQILNQTFNDTNYYVTADTVTTGSIEETYKTVALNLKAYNSVETLNANGDLETKVFDLGDGKSITKTWNYLPDGSISSIVLSGDTPDGINLTKTFSYNNNEIQITYS